MCCFPYGFCPVFATSVSVWWALRKFLGPVYMSFSTGMYSQHRLIVFTWQQTQCASNFNDSCLFDRVEISVCLWKPDVNYRAEILGIMNVLNKTFVRIVGRSKLKEFAWKIVSMKSFEDLDKGIRLMINLRVYFYFFQEILKYFGQIVRALHHIHQHMILHRDMKTHNILLDRRKKVVKICDFGISKFLTQTNAMTVST